MILRKMCCKTLLLRHITILGNSSKTVNCTLGSTESLPMKRFQQLAKLKKMQKTDEDAEYYMQNLVAQNAEHDAEEIQVLLQKAIQTLPEKQKLVFNIRYYDELPFEEISNILEMSVSTCKTNYHYAKEK